MPRGLILFGVGLCGFCVGFCVGLLLDGFGSVWVCLGLIWDCFGLGLIWNGFGLAWVWFGCGLLWFGFGFAVAWFGFVGVLFWCALVFFWIHLSLLIPDRHSKRSCRMELCSNVPIRLGRGGGP